MEESLPESSPCRAPNQLSPRNLYPENQGNCRRQTACQDDDEEMEEDGHAHDVEEAQDVNDDFGGAPLVPPKKRKKTNMVRTHYRSHSIDDQAHAGMK